FAFFVRLRRGRAFGFLAGRRFRFRFRFALPRFVFHRLFFFARFEGFFPFFGFGFFGRRFFAAGDHLAQPRRPLRQGALQLRVDAAQRFHLGADLVGRRRGAGAVPFGGALLDPVEVGVDLARGRAGQQLD